MWRLWQIFADYKISTYLRHPSHPWGMNLETRANDFSSNN
jgi:hypothetical protein